MGRVTREGDGIGSGKLLGARSSQQDACLSERLEEEEAVLAIVADGMGGHAEGALASSLVVTAFRDAFVTARAHRSDLGPSFDEGLDAANRAIAEAQRDHPEREGMGTTLVAAHLSKQGVAWVSVGDSLLLLHSKGVLRRLNDDHSLRALPGNAGLRGNMLRSAVTGSAIAMVDRQPDPVRVGGDDRLVLASDGVLTLSMHRLAVLLTAAQSRPAQACAEAVVEAVQRAGDPKQDNCTVLVLNGPEEAGAPAPRRGPGASSVILAALGLALAGVIVLVLFW
jgi:serine/threonine protein phosphatase PrpC